MSKDSIKQLFKSYPSVDKFFVTEDGQAFENEHRANDHAKFLDKKKPKVTTVERDDEEMEAKAAAEKAAAAKQAAVIAAAEKAAADKAAAEKAAAEKAAADAKAKGKK